MYFVDHKLKQVDPEEWDKVFAIAMPQSGFLMSYMTIKPVAKDYSPIEIYWYIKLFEHQNQKLFRVREVMDFEIDMLKDFLHSLGLENYLPQKNKNVEKNDVFLYFEAHFLQDFEIKNEFDIKIIQR